MAGRVEQFHYVDYHGFRNRQGDYNSPQFPEQRVRGMFGWKRKKDETAEETRKVRGRLAVKIVELDRERVHLENLMKRMLEERAKHV